MPQRSSDIQMPNSFMFIKNSYDNSYEITYDNSLYSINIT